MSIRRTNRIVALIAFALLGAVSCRQFDGGNENRQFAFLFNVYNTATLKLIIDH